MYDNTILVHTDQDHHDLLEIVSNVVVLTNLT